MATPDAAHEIAPAGRVPEVVGFAGGVHWCCYCVKATAHLVANSSGSGNPSLREILRKTGEDGQPFIEQFSILSNVRSDTPAALANSACVILISIRRAWIFLPSARRSSGSRTGFLDTPTTHLREAGERAIVAAREWPIWLVAVGMAPPCTAFLSRQARLCLRCKNNSFTHGSVPSMPAVGQRANVAETRLNETNLLWCRKASALASTNCQLCWMFPFVGGSVNF